MYPRRIRRVKPYGLVVQQGDTVASIAQDWTGDWTRYSELVGANMHLGTVGAPPWGRHRVLAQLDADQSLFVPFCWPEPMGFGSVGIDPLRRPAAGQAVRIAASPAAMDAADAFVAAILTVWSQLMTHSGQDIPPSADLARLLWAIWPHMYNTLPGIVPGQVPAALPFPPDYQALGTILGSLDTLIKTSGVSADRLGRVPWSNVPWNSFPWGSVANVLGPGGFASGWQWIERCAQGPSPSTPVQLADGQAPDFSDSSQWSQPPWRTSPLGELTWNDRILDFLSDGDIAACAQHDPAQLKKIRDCGECFEGQGIDTFRKYLCDPSLDPCFCRSTNIEQPPTNQPPGGQPAQEKESGSTGLLIGVGIAVVAGVAVLVATR